MTLANEPALSKGDLVYLISEYSFVIAVFDRYSDYYEYKPENETSKDRFVVSNNKKNLKSNIWHLFFTSGILYFKKPLNVDFGSNKLNNIPNITHCTDDSIERIPNLTRFGYFNAINHRCGGDREFFYGVPFGQSSGAYEERKWCGLFTRTRDPNDIWPINIYNKKDEALVFLNGTSMNSYIPLIEKLASKNHKFLDFIINII
ncbi:MAG: hypothetical protein AABX19_01040 [Nanoarchaeota archaeon]